MSGSEGDGGFHHLGDDEVHRGYVLRLVNGRFLGPKGEEFERDIVRVPGAVGVVPVTEDGEVVLVRQYRGALDAELLEIPAGLRDIPGEDPADTARRELIEETGYQADTLQHLSTFQNAAGMTDQTTTVYLATGLTEVGSAREGVEEAYLTVETLPLEGVRQLILDGTVSDAKTVVGLLLAAHALGVDPG